MKDRSVNSYPPGKSFYAHDYVFLKDDFIEVNLTERGLLLMNARQKKFCDEYLIDCNATQAAIRAGYSPKTAYSIGEENLKKPELKAYIDEQLELLHSKRTADAQEVLEYLTSVMRGEHTEQTLQLVGDGVQTITDIDVSAKERLKAAELIGKRYGMFKDNINLGESKVILVDEVPEDW
jgi:phage terminase small subunit